MSGIANVGQQGNVTGSLCALPKSSFSRQTGLAERLFVLL